MRSAWLIVFAFATVAAGAAEVYRSVDAEGNVSYSDRPDGENTETVLIATRRPAAIPPRPAAADPAASRTESVDGSGELQREPREPTAEERAEDRARNCAIAQERQERYAISRRLYRETPDGEREYLNDAELDEARAKAAADVQQWCD